MADLGKTLIKLSAKLVEYQAKKILGESVVSALAGGVTEFLGENFKEWLDKAFNERGDAKNIIKAFETADQDFVKRCQDYTVKSAIETFGLAISKDLRDLAADLPDTLDADNLQTAIRARIEHDWPGKLTKPQLEYATELYFECLERALATQSGQIMQVIYLGVEQNTKLSQKILKEIADLSERIKKQSTSTKYWGVETGDRVNGLISQLTRCFSGRKSEKQQLNNFIEKSPSGMLMITAGAGFGKSALLANWLQELKKEKFDVAYHFFSSQTDRSLEKAYLSIFHQVNDFYNTPIEITHRDENSLREGLYGFLGDKTIKRKKPLVIIMDGLDEAEKPFLPFLPKPLPDSIFLVASARANPGEEHEYLHGWMENSQHIQLDRLLVPIISEWLANAGNGELAGFASDDNFTAKISELTQGFPLYLAFLIDELIQKMRDGQDAYAVLSRTPHGFQKYIEQQVDLLDDLEIDEPIRKLLVLLAVAKGPLSSADLKSKALLGLSDRDIRKLKRSWQVTRWLHNSEYAGNDSFSFTHPLLADSFTNLFGDESEHIEKILIEYCSRWEENQSPYALEYLPYYLKKSKDWDNLIALARNNNFFTLQGQILTDKPGLGLQTIQIALEVALDQDRAAIAAEFLLSHSRRLIDYSLQENPLDALRAKNLQRAKYLVTLQEEQRRPLWYLLLIWELAYNNLFEAAQSLLDELASSQLSFLSDWVAEMGACLMAGIPEDNRLDFNGLFNNLFGMRDYLKIFGYSLAFRNYHLAIIVLRYANDRSELIDMVESALVFFEDQSSEFVSALVKSKAWAWKKWEESNDEKFLWKFKDDDAALGVLAEVLAKKEKIELAEDVAQKISDLDDLKATLLEIKEIKTRIEEGKGYFFHSNDFGPGDSKPLELLEKLNKEGIFTYYRNWGFNSSDVRSMVHAPLFIFSSDNDNEKIRELLGLILNSPESALYQQDQAIALATAASALAKDGTFTESNRVFLNAFNSALEIENLEDGGDSVCLDVLRIIAVKSASVGAIDFAKTVLEKAKIIADKIPKNHNPVHDLDCIYWAISVAYAKQGNFPETLKQINDIESTAWKIEAMLSIALDFVAVRNTVEARRFLRHAYRLLLMEVGRNGYYPCWNDQNYEDEVWASIARTRQKFSLSNVFLTHRPDSSDLQSWNLRNAIYRRKIVKKYYWHKQQISRFVVSPRIRAIRKQWFELRSPSLSAIKRIEDALYPIILLFEMVDLCAKAENQGLPQNYINLLREMSENLMEDYPSRYIKSKCILAASLARFGDQQQSKDTFREIVEMLGKYQGEPIPTGSIEKDNTDDLMGFMAVWQAEGGLGADALHTFSEVRKRRWAYFHEIAESLLNFGDLTNFKKIVLLGVYDYGIALQMCALLVKCYPSEADSIADIIIRYTKSAPTASEFVL